MTFDSRLALRFAGFLSLALALQSCSSSDPNSTIAGTEPASTADQLPEGGPPAAGATLVSLSLTPATVTVHVKGGTRFALSSLWSDGNTSSPGVTWTATGGTISTGGYYTAGSTRGTYRVIATAKTSSRADTSVVKITSLTKITLSPATVSLSAGGTRQFTAQGTYSDGAVEPKAVVYSATGGTISSGGLYTAGNTAGTYRVIAVSSGGTLADTSVITISSAVTLTSLSLTPASASITTGAAQQFAVSGVMSNGTTSTPAVNYSATGGTITTGGLYTAGATAGSYRVIAVQQGGSHADTSVVTVSSAVTLASLSLTPASTSVSAGASQQFAVSGVMSNGTTTTPAVNYSATGGTITTSGLYTAGSAAGNFRVVAVQQGGSHADTSAVTVTAQVSAGSYSSAFPLTENPVSEGGKWHHTDSYQAVVKTVNGRAFGTQTGAGTNGDPYDDASAYLTGFPSNYEVEATVWLNPNYSGAGNREVEILLRWSDTGPARSTTFGNTHANGYEINVQHAGSYMQLGRFKGANLAQINNYAVPKSGDRFRARIEGQRIRVWWNDVLKIDYTDSNASLKITSGNPGMGFYVSGGSPNTDFGFESITVTPLP